MTEPLLRITDCGSAGCMPDAEGEYLRYDDVVELVQKVSDAYMKYDGGPGESHEEAMKVFSQALGIS